MQLTVSLQFAELEYQQSTDGSGSIVFSLVLPPDSEEAGERSAWCLVAESSDATLRLLVAAGAHGAVRFDLYDFYNVEPDVIGSGGYSTVHLAKAVVGDERQMAVKAILPQRTVRASIMREVENMLLIGQHPNSIAFHGLFRLSNTPEKDAEAEPEMCMWAMVTPFYSRGDLHEAINDLCGIPEPRMLNIFAGVAAALAHVHKFELMHRDVKADNILLDGDEGDHAVLCDYGIACRTDDLVEIDRRGESPGYVAPEVLKGAMYGCAVDNFGAGVVLFFGLSGQLPFHGKNSDSTMRKNKAAKVNIQDTPGMAKVSIAAQNLVRGLLKRDPAMRLTARGALEHEALHSSPVCPETAQQVAEMVEATDLAAALEPLELAAPIPPRQQIRAPPCAGPYSQAPGPLGTADAGASRLRSLRSLRAEAQPAGATTTCAGQRLDAVRALGSAVAGTGAVPAATP